jgi:pimeloyl-ACP methyl ester carboxylesterase
VLIETDSGRVLAGTFTRPVRDTSGAPPRAAVAVLLLSGSGPQDRDGARADLPGYAPLRDLADSLGASGLAVLRTDDRGVAGSSGEFIGTTTLDFARDAERAIAWLRRQPGIDPDHIALVGHSEGALVAMLVASRDTAISDLVLLGASSQTGREVARWQRAALVAHDTSAWPAGSRASVLAAADSNAERAASRDAWLRTWFALDPRVIARGVRARVLLIHGEHDQQVPSSHAGELAAALRDGGAGDVSVRRFPSTNHLLLEDRDGDPTRYAQLTSRRVRGEITGEIADWLRVRAPR